MRVLIACEFSGVVRDAFRERGHDAWSCDLLPTEREGPHIQGNVLPVAANTWDLLIAHPPCTFLCNSGVRWLIGNKGRWKAMNSAAAFFNALLIGPVPRIAVENPIQHGYARDILPLYQQLIQPWQFGHGETKATCLWLKNLPPLMPTEIVRGRRATVHRMPPSP